MNPEKPKVAGNAKYFTGNCRMYIYFEYFVKVLRSYDI
jgi:hypothetical protein